MPTAVLTRDQASQEPISERLLIIGNLHAVALRGLHHRADRAVQEALELLDDMVQQ